MVCAHSADAGTARAGVARAGQHPRSPRVGDDGSQRVRARAGACVHVRTCVRAVRRARGVRACVRACVLVSTELYRKNI